ncbi:hypothetical protein [Bordetella genomosp. 13]|uniref:Uncharacterized protein n=1 Tax=Bordetella genomosp. 13 TaxID=463040 RepID=A0A1W6ZH81_9BORD|nr:hypothetical protein [Bordetella genomosp. 13]ARP96657.1 hypothetical protein CAL15_21185 [Bordetella genomosp. 13]
MIPVSIPGGNYYASLVLSLICLSTLLTWLARLAISRRSRMWLREHRRLGPAMMAALAVTGSIFPYQHIGQWLAAQRDAREEQARRAVLESARRLAGVDMPAGTTLRLTHPGDLESFTQADFPALVEVGGLQASQLFRYRRPAGPDGPAKETWSVTLAADQSVQGGWRCSRSHRAELIMEDGRPRFDSCHLASGNTLGNLPLPTGTWVDLRQAMPQRWLLRVEGSEPATVAGLALLKADISVDSQRQLLTFEGLLAEELRLGDLTYPTGTRAGSAAGVRGAQPGDLVFSPPRGRAARRAGQPDIASGNTVVQAPDGTVRSVLSNRDAGVLDVATMQIGP